MEKISNFKVYFNNFLEREYDADEETKEEYWSHRADVEACKNAKKRVVIPSMAAAGVGVAGILVGAFNPIGLNTCAQTTCIVTSSLVTGAGCIISAASLINNNPYDGKEAYFKDIDKDYKKELKKYKKSLK